MVDYLPAPKRVATDRRLAEQVLGFAQERPIVPAGLAPFMKLPDAEPRTITRARMADVIARAVSATGCITRDDLTANGFTDTEIAEHFTEAKRIARVAEMAV